jgi:general secretion pathway protein G
VSLFNRSRFGAGAGFASAEPPAGFTVFELLLVVGLVAVLSGMVLAAGHTLREGSRVSRAASELAVLATALESYRLDHGDYPRTDASAALLQALIGRRGPAGDAVTSRPCVEVSRFSRASERDPFVDTTAELLDPWGTSYRYAYKSATPWSNPSFVLYSCGPDGSASEGLLAGGYPDRAAASNGDNLWALPP